MQRFCLPRVCLLFNILLFVLLLDKRIARQYGYSARKTRPVVSDYCYSRWVLHYSAIAAISSEGIIAIRLLKNPEEIFNARSFSRFLHEHLLPAMNYLTGKTRNPYRHGKQICVIYQVFYIIIFTCRIIIYFKR